jgi:Fe-S cluster assembly iron-binding protein IscA
MLTLTEAATAHLAEMTKLPPMQPDKVVRFVIEDGGVQMTPDQERPGDITFKHEEETILVFDESVSQALKGFILDLTEESGTARLTVKPKTE